MANGDACVPSGPWACGTQEQTNRNELYIKLGNDLPQDFYIYFLCVYSEKLKCKVTLNIHQTQRHRKKNGDRISVVVEWHLNVEATCVEFFDVSMELSTWATSILSCDVCGTDKNRDGKFSIKWSVIAVCSKVQHGRSYVLWSTPLLQTPGCVYSWRRSLISSWSHGILMFIFRSFWVFRLFSPGHIRIPKTWQSKNVLHYYANLYKLSKYICWHPPLRRPPWCKGMQHKLITFHHAKRVHIWRHR